MSLIILIVIGVIGAGLGYHLASRKARSGGGSVSEREKRKEKVLELFNTNKKVTNNDVEQTLGVSDATAERYLNELEKEGKLIQHGSTGKSVFYTLK